MRVASLPAASSGGAGRHLGRRRRGTGPRRRGPKRQAGRGLPAVASKSQSVALSHADSPSSARLLLRRRLRGQRAGRVPARRRGAPERRRPVAADLGLSETVFVDDAERGEVRIFTPAVELDFAGHPRSARRGYRGHGRAARRGRRSPSAATASWCTWPPGPSGAAAEPSWPAGRGGRPGRSAGRTRPPHGVVVDRRAAGVVRARAFSLGSGSPRTRPPARRPPSCASSSGARSTSGRGSSRILARPGEDGFVEIGGRSVLDEVGTTPALSELLVAHAQDRERHQDSPDQNTAAPAMKYAFDTIAVSVPTIRTASPRTAAAGAARALSRGSDGEHQHSDDEAERREVVRVGPLRTPGGRAAPRRRRWGPRNEVLDSSPAMPHAKPSIVITAAAHEPASPSAPAGDRASAGAAAPEEGEAEHRRANTMMARKPITWAACQRVRIGDQAHLLELVAARELLGCRRLSTRNSSGATTSAAAVPSR